MITTERHVLKSLQRVAGNLPETITERDSRYIIEAMNAAMTALLDAEEPINKTHRYHERAKRITEDLEAFVQHRSEEQWSDNSTDSYATHLAYENNRKKA